MKTNKRYGFWKVFWVVLAVYILFTLIGVIVITLVPMPAPGPTLEDMFSGKHLLSQLVNFVFAVFYYYFSVNFFYGLMLEKKGVLNYLKVVLVAGFVFGLYYALTFTYLTPEKFAKENMPFGLAVFSYTVATVLYIGISLLIAYLTFLRDEKKQRKILEEQKLQLEVEKSAANFNFLKAQINPHFLHNTLNFLYAKSLPYSAELSEGILTLSDIMRYALSESTARDGKAPLKDEIEHVRNVIKINQLRFSNNLNVQFDVEGVVNGATIIPFVLITLVENAFKHGDLKSVAEPIVINLKVDKNSIYFYCRNKKKSGPKELSTGIGLENIKKRLELAYGKNHTFTVKDEADFYTTELTIQSL